VVIVSGLLAPVALFAASSPAQLRRVHEYREALVVALPAPPFGAGIDYFCINGTV
jgi:hypothetical protein